MNDEWVKDVVLIGHVRKDPREDRLKQALRENLKRRKSQSRGRSASPVTGTDDDTPKDDATKTDGY